MISYISNDELKKCVDEAKNNPRGIARRNLHSEGSDLMQCMLIAFSPSVIYPPISDSMPGQIIFTCIDGELEITIHDEIFRERRVRYILHPGELIALPRSSFRSTKSGNCGAVFLESIEGPFNPAIRRCLKDKFE